MDKAEDETNTPTPSRTIHLGNVWLNGVKITDEVTVDARITLNSVASAGPPQYVPAQSIMVHVEITTLCLPLSWTEQDTWHAQN